MSDYTVTVRVRVEDCESPQDASKAVEQMVMSAEVLNFRVLNVEAGDTDQDRNQGESEQDTSHEEKP